VRPELRGDTGDDALAFERFGKRRRRPDPVERKRCLVAERLEQAEFLDRERTPLRHARNGQHRAHSAVREERYESDALRTHLLDESPVDERRRLRVEDRKRRAVEHGACGP
jgi:hypothetical protein